MVQHLLVDINVEGKPNFFSPSNWEIACYTKPWKNKTDKDTFTKSQILEDVPNEFLTRYHC